MCLFLPHHLTTPAKLSKICYQKYKRAIRDSSELLLHKIYVESWLHPLALLYNKVTKMFLIKRSFETNSQLRTVGISSLHSPGRVDTDDVLWKSPEAACSLLGEEHPQASPRDPTLRRAVSLQPR